VLAKAPTTKDGSPTFHRVLWASYRDQKIVLMDLVEDVHLKEPYFMELSEVESLLGSGHYYKTKYLRPAYMLLAEQDIPEKNKSLRDRNWRMIKPLFDPSLQPGIYTRAQRGPLVTRIATANRKTRRAILSLLYRGYKYGGAPESVMPKWPNCGAPGKTREPKERKRGRKPKVVVTGHAPEKLGINVNKDTRSKILLGVDTFCSLDDRVPIAKAYQDTKDRYFVELSEKPDGSLVTVPMPSNQVPTLGQFRYYAKQRIGQLDFARRRQGERNYLQSARPLTGTARSGLIGPGHLFEIDSTVADVYLVSRYNPEWVIGRPVIYVVIDTFSRLIVGLYIGLFGPSWEGARLALANALSPKVGYCARHGIHIAIGDWPSHHFPYSIAADRAEMLCKAAEDALKNLRIELATPGPYRPDWKGTVERRFRILNDVTINWLAGAVRQRQRDMRRRGYVLDATLNIDEFTHVIINCVLEHNLTVQREDLLTREMIAAGVRPYSIDFWNWGVANLTGPLRSEDEDLVRTHLLPSANATVTERGILCHGMLYSCERAVAEGWFERARRSRTWAVPVKTEYITNTIYLAPPAVKQFEVCHLLDPEERYTNMRVEEAIDCLEYLRLSATDYSDRDERTRHALHARSNSVIQAATERKRVLRKSSSTKHGTKQIREHRVLDAQAERILEIREAAKTDAKVLPLQNGSKAQATPESSGPKAEIITLLRDQRAKKWEVP
jgi:hypothetical protein